MDTPAECNGYKKLAAQSPGIGLKTLYNKLKRYEAEKASLKPAKMWRLSGV